MNQVLCSSVGCTGRGYWIEVASNGEPLFCFRTRHNGENHSVKMTIGQILVASMPKLMNEQQPESFDVTANYIS